MKSSYCITAHSRPRVALMAGAMALSIGLLTGCSNPSLSSSGTNSAQAAAIPSVSSNPELAAAVPEKFRKAGEIRVATNAPFAPYEMFAGPGSEELVGLEIDLGHAVGQKLGVPFKFSQQPFDGLIPGLQAGKYDLLMASLFDTEEREKALDFVNYARSGSGVMVKKETSGIATLNDLCGLSTAVQKGTLQVQMVQTQSTKCLADGRKAVDLKTFPSFSDEQLALNGGTVTAIVGDLPALAYVSTQDQSVTVLDDPAAPGGYDSSPIGFGIPKTEKTLGQAIFKAVEELVQDGTYKAILEKYGVPQTALDAPSTNQYGG